jgi:3-deoxy-D-manno-octulosonic acid kinase
MRSHKIIQDGRTYILYDPNLLPQVSDDLFEPAELERKGLLRQRTTGRRSAFIFGFGDNCFVLRHFWRGGLVGKVLTDQYVWVGLARSRPFREWQVLQALGNQGLPVPRPAAARVRPCGACYRGDLITEQLPQTRTLADRLQEAPLAANTWNSIGSVLHSLHSAGADHADLNARNVLLDAADRVYVIDWDRGRIRTPARHWQMRNIGRLFHSLRKISAQTERFHYVEAPARHHLLAGYRDGCRR